MSTVKDTNEFTAIDLFSGGGGLTVGLKRAGFKVVSAVEKEQSAFATYKLNHPEVAAYRQDIREIDGASLAQSSASGTIDLVAGCPPCQGFTSLTAKWRRSDPRNELVLEMGRIVSEVRPLAVMMENVPGLATKGKALLSGLISQLEGLGYQVSYDVLQVADYGTPQTRKRLVLLAGNGFAIPLPTPSHSNNRSTGLPQWRTVRDTIADLPEPDIFVDVRTTIGHTVTDWHVTRKLTAVNMERIRSVKSGEHRSAIPKHLRPKCHRDSDIGFSNVYGRMEWDHASPTITGGCTTLSKGRFGHPVADRTISVREAALLQEFPEEFQFQTRYIDQVCNIIGNALPCGFATAMAVQAAKEISRHRN